MRGTCRKSLHTSARRGVCAALSAGLLLATIGTGHAASFLEKNFWLSGPNYSGNVPACDTPAALSDIQSRFSQTESRFWNSSLKIDSIQHVREIAFRPWGPEYQPRRYCSAEVYVTGTIGHVSGQPVTSQYVGGKIGKAPSAQKVNAARHTVYYSIIEDGGFIGATWGIEYCVEGFDRSWTYAPNCRMAQP